MANTGEHTSADINTSVADEEARGGGIAARQEEPDEAAIATFIETANKLEQELRTIVIGQERVIRELLLALLAGGHVLLEGVPGLGKTLL
ncbi:MAG TPA: hypothetical protein VFU49_22530, partial [Ktedonobacteraceae bacterium]|nr:hypothetical protein [Ktedonobacteraceae bacterium]